MSGVRGRALSHPRLPALLAGCRGPLPTGCGCGGLWAWGPVTKPTARALASWLLRAVGAAGRCPWGGASCLGVGRPGSGALPPPTARPLGGLPGPTTHWLWVRGGAGVGTRHQPHSVRSCMPWGRLEGARGGRLLPGSGASGVGRSPTPDCPPSWRAAWAHYPMALGAGGCRRGEPSPTRQRALLRALGVGLRVPGGGAPRLGVDVRGRALSNPRLPALLAGCRGPLPTGCGCGGLWAWGPVTKPTARALARWLLRAVGAAGGCPWGGASCLGVGRPGSGALRPPTARPLGGLPGPTTHWLWVRGGAGVGTRHQPHSARSCMPWGRLEGARGGRLLPGSGASGVGRSPTPDCPPSGRAAGAHYPLAVDAGGCGRGDPSPNPQRAFLRAGFARCGGGTRVPWEVRLLPGCGASGVGRSPAPDCPPSGRAAGAHYPLAVGVGGCGRGDPSPTPQRALLRAVGAA